jgi:hypothetical protein
MTPDTDTTDYAAMSASRRPPKKPTLREGPRAAQG